MCCVGGRWKGGGREGEGRGGREGEGGREGGREGGKEEWREGRGGREGRDDCYTYSDGTTLFI